MPASFFQGDPRRWRVAFSNTAAGRAFGTDSQPILGGEAFLVLCGPESTWRNVFRLDPEKVMTVGREREPVNRLVLDDERCSRRHCEIFFGDEDWFLRDLKSRNGTMLNQVKVDGETCISDGDRIRIGKTVLLFTTDISNPLTDDPEDVPEDAPGTEDVSGSEIGTEDVVSDPPEPQILERKAHTRYVNERGLADVSTTSLRETFGTLSRLIFSMASAEDVHSLSKIVLDALLTTLDADIAAMLLFPDETVEKTPDQLRIVGYQSPENTPYQLVSRRLSQTVLTEREAVLAMDIRTQSGKSEYKTLDQINAESVICAPIRCKGQIFGLLHLYALNPENRLDAEALEFTLAVADQVGTALEILNQKETLSTGLRVVFDENQSLKRLLEFESELVGTSPEMAQLRETIARVAPSEATALVRGESGVGKELVARAVHFNSGRREGPFVCLNCAALTESLLESELFGHERGSFTGATTQKLGKFEQADTGTLFLDEVGEMPLSIQAKFLRVLEGHPFERVGGSTSVKADVRVVAATNRNLESAVESSDFRRDLFFRLQILEVSVPSLREHASDIPLLAEHFLGRCDARVGGARHRISEEAMRTLCDYEWPGNVRELRNVIERAVVLAENSEIVSADIRFSTVPGDHDSRPARESFQPISLDEIERRHIVRMLEWTNGRKREAARLLGINRSTLDRKLDRYSIAGKDAEEVH